MVNQSNQPVSVQTGDEANVVAVAHGEVNFNSNYYSFYGSTIGGAARVDLESYRASISKQYSGIKSTYTLLDINHVVSTLGRDLKTVEGPEASLIEAVANSQRLVIFGGAGAGKTTSLRFISAAITSDPESLPAMACQNPEACLFIDLTRFRTHESLTSLQSILVLIGEILHEPSELAPPSLGAIHELLSSRGRFILLFDGLNEVPLRARLCCLNGLVDLAKKYSKHRYVVTSRPHGFLPIDSEWAMCEIKGLKATQVQDFLSRYTDRETGRKLAALLQSNPLAQVPLFLSYILKIYRAGVFDESILNSRSQVTGSYVEILLNRDRKEFSGSIYFKDIGVLKSALMSLADKTNLLGQSIAFKEAVILLARRETVDTQTAASIVDELLSSTLLVRDGQYVRFWHQTIQEHFCAAGTAREWSLGRGKVFGARWSMWRAVGKTGDRGPLLHIPYFLSNEELCLTIKRVIKWDIELAVMWVDDIFCEDGRRPLVFEATGAIRRRAIQVRRYSRLGSTLKFLAFFSIYPLIFVLPLAEKHLGPSNSNLFPWLVNVSMLAWFYILIESFRVPKPEVLDDLLSATFQIRNRDFRASVVSIADEVSRSILTAYSQKSLAISVAKSGVEGDAYSMLRNSPSLSAGIAALGRIADERAVPILKFCLRYHNATSENAMTSLVKRLQSFPDEKEQIASIAAEILSDPDSECPLLRGARRCLKIAGVEPVPAMPQWAWLRYPSVKGLRRRILDTIVAAICAYVAFIGLVSICRFVGHLTAPYFMHMGLTSFLVVSIVLMGSFLYYNVKKSSKGVEDVSPIWWGVYGLMFCFSIPAFYFCRSKMRADAVPIDWEALKAHLREI